MIIAMLFAIYSNLSGDPGWFGRDFAFMVSALFNSVIGAAVVAVIMAIARRWRLLGAFLLVMVPLVFVGAVVTPKIGNQVENGRNERFGRWASQPMPSSFATDLQALEPSLPVPAVKKVAYIGHGLQGDDWVIELSFTPAILTTPPSRIAGIARIARAADPKADAVDIQGVATFRGPIGVACTKNDEAALPCGYWNDHYLAAHTGKRP